MRGKVHNINRDQIVIGEEKNQGIHLTFAGCTSLQMNKGEELGFYGKTLILAFHINQLLDFATQISF